MRWGDWACLACMSGAGAAVDHQRHLYGPLFMTICARVELYSIKITHHSYADVTMNVNNDL